MQDNQDIHEYVRKLTKKELKAEIKPYHVPRSLKPMQMKRAELVKLLEHLLEKGISKAERKKMPKEYGAGILDLFKPIKQDYSNGSRSTLEKYGSGIVTHLVAKRTPIVQMLNTVLNLISLGQFNKSKKEYGFDKLYHLALIATVNNKSIVVEKNEVINISTSYSMNDKTESIEIPLNGRQITLQEMMDNTLKRVGKEQFFLYDPFSRNCQDFLVMILQSNGLGNQQDFQWIKQDISNLAKEQPSYVHTIAKVTTDLGARVSQAIGAGHVDDDNNDPICEACGTCKMCGSGIHYENPRGVELWKQKQEKIRKQNEEWRARNKKISDEIDRTKNDESFLASQQSKRKEQKMMFEKMKEFLMENYAWNAVKPDMNTFIKQIEESHDCYIKQDPETGKVEVVPIHENAWDRINEVMPWMKTVNDGLSYGLNKVSNGAINIDANDISKKVADAMPNQGKSKEEREKQVQETQEKNDKLNSRLVAEKVLGSGKKAKKLPVVRGGNGKLVLMPNFKF